jgi:hypothetical protein
MQIREAKKLYRQRFDSLHELAQFVANTPRVWSVNSSEDNAPSHSWDLSAGFDGAVAMARDGWIEGAQAVQEALKAFTPKTPAPDTKVDFYGFRPHVPRFCAGAPDSMIRHAKPPPMGQGRVLTLVVPVNAQCSTAAVHMRNFGIAVAQYVNQLETEGTRVELIGCICNNWEYMQTRSLRHSFAWTIKNADQPLDLAVVAFAIGHPAMWRRLGFAVMERTPIKESRVYGYSQIPATADDIINAPPGTVILNGMQKAYEFARTPEAALTYVTKQIDKAIQEQEL